MDFFELTNRCTDASSELNYILFTYRHAKTKEEQLSAMSSLIHCLARIELLLSVLEEELSCESDVAKEKSIILEEQTFRRKVES